MIRTLAFVGALVLVESAMATGTTPKGPLRASGYNLISLGTVHSSNSDSEGGIAARGNINLTNYSVGDRTPGGNVLVSGSSITMMNGTIRGNARFGNSIHLTGVSLQGNQAKNVPLNFDNLSNTYHATTTAWGNLASNGTVSKPFSTINLKGTNAGLNIFSLDGSALAGASDVNIQVPGGATVLINLRGNNFTLPNFGYNLNGSQNPSAFSKVIWNAPDATNINMSILNGSLLAPKATINSNFGAINGQLIAGNFNGPMQLNYVEYRGSLQVVPEPATLTALGLGLAAILRRRKKA